MVAWLSFGLQPVTVFAVNASSPFVEQAIGLDLPNVVWQLTVRQGSHKPLELHQPTSLFFGLFVKTLGDFWTFVP